MDSQNNKHWTFKLKWWHALITFIGTIFIILIYVEHLNNKSWAGSKNQLPTMN